MEEYLAKLCLKKNFTSFDFFFKITFAKTQNDFLLYKHLLKFPNVNLHWVNKNGDWGYNSVGIITVKNYYNRFCHGFSSEDDVIEEIPEKNTEELFHYIDILNIKNEISEKNNEEYNEILKRFNFLPKY